MQLYLNFVIFLNYEVINYGFIFGLDYTFFGSCFQKWSRYFRRMIEIELGKEKELVVNKNNR